MVLYTGLYMIAWALVQSAPPSVYWVSSPTHANETLMIAGAGLDGVTAELCSPACSVPADTVSWSQSVQLVLPTPLAAPTRVRITGKAGGSVVVAVK